MKILIVEDDAVSMEAMRLTLKSDGYEVVTADDGAKALELIEKQSPDLIITDVMMPNISGLGLLSLLKQFYFNKIPVILVSSLDKAKVILSGLGLGAEDFMVKPIDLKELSMRVKKYLQKSSDKPN